MAFLKFSIILGFGWILDFFSYLTVIYIFNFQPKDANFISSAIGVTFVWLISLSRVFHKGSKKYSKYLFIYWGFQIISISGYSFLISYLVMSKFNVSLSSLMNLPIEILTKILVTPLNLLTNYIFMKLLTKIISPRINHKAN